MSEYVYNCNTGELYHYGVLGMKWGVRRAKKYQDKARSGIESSKQGLEKAKKSNASRFNREEKTMKRALGAAETAYNAQRNAEKSDRIMEKHERKFQKKVAKNERAIEKAKERGVDKETIDRKIEKAKKFIDTHVELTKSVRSITNQTDEQQRRVHDFVKYMEERNYWNQKITEGSYNRKG